MSRHERPNPNPDEQAILERAASATDAETARLRAAYPLGYGAKGLPAHMIRRENVGQSPMPELPPREETTP